MFQVLQQAVQVPHWVIEGLGLGLATIAASAVLHGFAAGAFFLLKKIRWQGEHGESSNQVLSFPAGLSVFPRRSRL